MTTPSDHILSLLGGRDNLTLMCEAHDFEQTSKDLRFTVEPYRIVIQPSFSDLFDRVYDIHFINLNTNGTYKRSFVCDWWIPDLFTSVTGYSLSF